jgi:2'-5' RNA ligase
VSAPRARLFVAADLPERIREGLGEWARERLAPTPQLRLVAPANLHVTLCFLGWRQEAEIDALSQLTAGSARSPCELSLAALTWLPARRPRVAALDVVDAGGRLADLQRALSDELESRAGYEPESRPFRPHVTVARVRSGARLPRRVRPQPPPPRLGSFRASALTLYRSRLGRGGASYEPVTRVALA